MTPLLRKPLLALAATAIALMLPACADAGAGASKAEIEKIVRDYIIENPEIIEEALIALGEKEKVAQAAAARAAINSNADKLYSLASDYSIGPADARVTVVEFFDYRCGYCKRSVDWVRALPEEYDGQVRIVFKELPIFGGISETAALAALAAGKQDKYLEMHVGLMAIKSNDDLTDASIDKVAQASGINVARMRADMKSMAVQQQLSEMKILGQDLAVGGTPGFFIGEQHIEGANIPLLESAIEDALEG
ncbi:MAG: thioredoxin domain-containing protein [Hyphomonas sp.]|uniref:thioredoxin domain-containing protein n=1 Tax=Hyphomonas sp. TaxID=87 RepID=UPI0034A08B7D